MSSASSYPPRLTFGTAVCDQPFRLVPAVRKDKLQPRAARGTAGGRIRSRGTLRSRRQICRQGVRVSSVDSQGSGEQRDLTCHRGNWTVSAKNSGESESGTVTDWRQPSDSDCSPQHPNAIDAGILHAERDEPPGRPVVHDGDVVKRRQSRGNEAIPFVDATVIPLPEQRFMVGGEEEMEAMEDGIAIVHMDGHIPNGQVGETASKGSNHNHGGSGRPLNLQHSRRSSQQQQEQQQQQHVVSHVHQNSVDRRHRTGSAIVRASSNSNSNGNGNSSNNSDSNSNSNSSNNSDSTNGNITSSRKSMSTSHNSKSHHDGKSSGGHDDVQSRQYRLPSGNHELQVARGNQRSRQEARHDHSHHHRHHHHKQQQEQQARPNGTAADGMHTSLLLFHSPSPTPPHPHPSDPAPSPLPPPCPPFSLSLSPSQAISLLNVLAFGYAATSVVVKLMAGEPLPLAFSPPADVDVSAATSVLESAAAGLAAGGSEAGAAAAGAMAGLAAAGAAAGSAATVAAREVAAAAASGVDVSSLLSSVDPSLVTNLHTSVAFALRFVFAAAGLGAFALARQAARWNIAASSPSSPSPSPRPSPPNHSPSMHSQSTALASSPIPSLFRPYPYEPTSTAAADAAAAPATAAASDQSDIRPGMSHDSDVLHSLQLEHQRQNQQQQQQQQQYEGGHHSTLTDSLWHMQADDAHRHPALLLSAPDWPTNSLVPISHAMTAPIAAAAAPAWSASRDTHDGLDHGNHPLPSVDHSPVMALAMPCSCTFVSGGQGRSVSLHSATAMHDTLAGSAGKRRAGRRAATASAASFDVPLPAAVAYHCFCHEGEGLGEGLHCWCEPATTTVAALTAADTPTVSSGASAAADSVGGTTTAAHLAWEQQGIGEERGGKVVVLDADSQWQHTVQGGVELGAWQHTVQGGLELGVWMFLLYAAQAVGLQSASADDAAVILALSVVLVPFLESLTGRPIHTSVLLGAVLACTGVILLEGFGQPSSEAAAVAIADFTTADMTSAASSLTSSSSSAISLFSPDLLSFLPPLPPWLSLSSLSSHLTLPHWLIPPPSVTIPLPPLSLSPSWLPWFSLSLPPSMTVSIPPLTLSPPTLPSLSLSSIPVGHLWCLLSAVASAIHVVRSESLCSRNDPLTLVLLQLVTTALMGTVWVAASLAVLVSTASLSAALPAVTEFDAATSLALSALATAPIGMALLAGPLGTGLCEWLELESLRFVSASTATLILTLSSLWAALLAFLILGETWTAASAMGAFLIVLASVEVQIFSPNEDKGHK